VRGHPHRRVEPACVDPHRRVEPAWLQAGDLCGELSLTPSLTCCGRVLLWAGSSGISPKPCFTLWTSRLVSSGTPSPAPQDSHACPGEREGHFGFSPPCSGAPCPHRTGSFPPTLGSAVTAALCSSLQKVSCLHPGLQQRVGPERGERGVRPRPPQRRFHQIMRGGPAPSDPLSWHGGA